MPEFLSWQEFISAEPIIDFLTKIVAVIFVFAVTFVLSRWIKSSIARLGFIYDHLDDTLFVF